MASIEAFASAPSGRLYGLKAAIPDDWRKTRPGGTDGRDQCCRGPRVPSGTSSSLTRCRIRTTVEYLLMSIRCTTASWSRRFLDIVRVGVISAACSTESSVQLAKAASVSRKDNITRVLGYGPPIVEEAMSCASNRATLVGYGEVSGKRSPRSYTECRCQPSLERVTEPRSITLTLAWFSPVNVRHRAYRRAKLEIKPDRFGESIGVNRLSFTAVRQVGAPRLVVSRPL